MPHRILRNTLVTMTMVCGSLAVLVAQERLTPVQAERAAAEVHAFQGVLGDVVQRALDNLVTAQGASTNARFLPGAVTIESIAPPAPGAGLVFVVRVPDLVMTRSVVMSHRPIPVLPPPPIGATPDVAPLVTAAVKDALVDAVVRSSAPLTVDPDAWLTVVACAAQDPARVEAPAGSRKLYVMVRGSDLIAIQRQNLSEQDARKLVVVAER